MKNSSRQNFLLILALFVALAPLASRAQIDGQVKNQFPESGPPKDLFAPSPRPSDSPTMDDNTDQSSVSSESSSDGGMSAPSGDIDNSSGNTSFATEDPPEMSDDPNSSPIPSPLEDTPATPDWSWRGPAEDVNPLPNDPFAPSPEVQEPTPSAPSDIDETPVEEPPSQVEGSTPPTDAEMQQQFTDQFKKNLIDDANQLGMPQKTESGSDLSAPKGK